jgi:RimJ/RimL family protein N-acetyltransferase
MLQGKLIGLGAVLRNDLQQLMDWRNNPALRRYFREYRELNEYMQESWFANKVQNDPSTIMFSVRRLENQELLGCCGFVSINWVHRHAELSVYIGWNDSYIDKEGYARESCNLLLQYGFGELGLNKIWTEIYKFDNKKWELLKKLGFHQDGMLRDNYFYDGKWWDSRIVSFLATDYWKRLKRITVS